MQIRQMLANSNKHSIKCPYSMTPEYITIHNTANDASANNEVSYMIGNIKQTGFHIAVDDKEVVQGIPLNRNAWHAGDGNGRGNRKSIGIEICYSKSGGDRFNKAEDLAAELTAQLLNEWSWGIDRVKKHQDWSGKYCPHRTLDAGWNRFLNKIKIKLKEGSDVALIYKGLDLNNPDSMKVAVDIWHEVMQEKKWTKITQLEVNKLMEDLRSAQSQPAIEKVIEKEVIKEVPVEKIVYHENELKPLWQQIIERLKELFR